MATGSTRASSISRVAHVRRLASTYAAGTPMTRSTARQASATVIDRAMVSR